MTMPTDASDRPPAAAALDGRAGDVRPASGRRRTTSSSATSAARKPAATKPTAGADTTSSSEVSGTRGAKKPAAARKATEPGAPKTKDSSAQSASPVVGPRETPLSFASAYPDEPQAGAVTAGDAALQQRRTPTRGRALVTGATSGIGLELAKVLAAHGHDLILVARTQERLDRVAVDLRAAHGVTVETVTADLADPDGPHAIAEYVEATGKHLQVLVNNAGYGVYGAFTDTSLDDELGMLQLNITAVTALTKLLLPSVQAAGGRILNVASTAAFQPGPYMAAYYASKAYVLHFTEALATELRGTGVTVTALCPGVVPTGFQERAGVDGLPLVKAPGSMPPEKVAQQAYRGMMRGKRVVIPGVLNKFTVQAVRFSPRRTTAAIVRRLQSH